MERLDKLLAAQGSLSRSDIKAMAADGRIAVDGAVIKRADLKVDGERVQVTVDGRAVTVKKHLYLLLNKPAGYISSTEDGDGPTVLTLVPPALQRNGLFPAGRLDKDTTGLMIITDDGALAHRILSPARHVPKRYDVTLDTLPTAEMARRFAQGILLSDGACKPAELVITGGSTASVTLREGRYHQIKRMFAACGVTVLALRRTGMGSLLLPLDLAPGVCRELTPEELALLEKR